MKKVPREDCKYPHLKASTARITYKCDCLRCLVFDRERKRDYSNNYRIKKATKEFGLTSEQVKGLDGRCEICGCYAKGTKKERRLFVDHDHKTGKFRGALCNSCNVGLSNFKDDIFRLTKAASYLWRYHESNCM